MDLIVTIVRHGDTFAPGETPRRIGARTDLPLVASGQAQADALGRALAGEAFDRALAAPLRRTQETMARILARQSPAPEVESARWLTEIDHGPDEGQAEDAVVARIGASALGAWDREARAPQDWIINEPMRLDGWHALWAERRGHVLIVTSNGAARYALRSDAGLWEQAAVLPSLKLRTGAYGVIARTSDGLRLVAWDQRP